MSRAQGGDGKAPKESRQFLDMAQLCDLLNINVATGHRMRKAGNFVRDTPITKGKLHFDPRDVEAWISSRKKAG